MDKQLAIQQLREQIDQMQFIIQEQVEQADGNPVLHQMALSKSVPNVEAKFSVRRVLKGHFGKVYAMQWCPASAHFLASASQDGKIIIWNALNGTKVNAIPLRSSWVMTCAYSQSGGLVACGGLENVCYVYRLRDLSPTMPDNTKFPPTAELASHDGYLSCCRFLSDSEILTASGDSTCILWDINRRQPINKFVGHYGDVMSVAIHGTNTFASGSVDASVKLWDIRQNGDVPVKTFRGHESDVNTVAFFPDGNAVGTGSDDATSRLFDIRACRQVAKYAQDSSSVGVTSVAFSNSGRVLFSGYDDMAFIAWDAALANRIQNLDHDSRVSCLGINSDGKVLGVGSWDSFLRVF